MFSKLKIVKYNTKPGGVVAAGTFRLALETVQLDCQGLPLLQPYRVINMCVNVTQGDTEIREKWEILQV